MAFVTLFICIPACLLSIGIVNITIRLLILHQMQYIYIFFFRLLCGNYSNIIICQFSLFVKLPKLCFHYLCSSHA